VRDIRAMTPPIREHGNPESRFQLDMGVWLPIDRYQMAPGDTTVGAKGPSGNKRIELAPVSSRAHRLWSAARAFDS
jgi:hypothetical protein